MLAAEVSWAMAVSILISAVSRSTSVVLRDWGSRASMLVPPFSAKGQSSCENTRQRKRSKIASSMRLWTDVFCQLEAGQLITN